MIEISSSNENVIVRQMIEDASDEDGCPESKPGVRTSSPLPSLDNLSISTASPDHSSNDSSSNSNSDNNDSLKDNNAEDASEILDCSSSVSSQDSSVRSNVAPKRSVFSQYWKNTGQTPVPLRPVKSPHFLSATEEETDDVVITSPKASSLHSPLDEQLSPSVTDAELLEDDGGSCSKDEEANKQQNFHKTPETPPPSGFPQPRRRRSILPPAPKSLPPLRSTEQKRSWRKSASLSSVEDYSRRSLLSPKDKTQSLPGMRSSFSGALSQPGPSCLRPQPKYSPDVSNLRRSLEFSPSLSSHTLPSMHMSSSTLPSYSSAPMLHGRLSRSGSSVSSTSSVSFLDTVDVRHFETPKETYSGKGWSDYFN